ncbi:MAG: aminotransferase class V-fold PLP-dependent enzyme, partial [Actinomycetia bacterium]|nr:aminotransferase class V-fold PLP-dependent enzyme [Actinomycetes bacterium]
GVYFHTDAVQSGGILDLNVSKLHIDLASFSSHKFYGPKGIGALYIKKGTKMSSLIHGGHQEKRRRAGTENVTGIIGFGKAYELASREKKKERERLKRLRDYFIEGLFKNIGDVYLNGHPEKRLPNNISISIKYVEGESMLLNLDLKGIASSSGSACTSDTLEPTHVLKAIGIPLPLAHGCLRFSFGKWTTKEELDYVLKVFPKIIKNLRKISPKKFK